MVEELGESRAKEMRSEGEEGCDGGVDLVVLQGHEGRRVSLGEI